MVPLLKTNELIYKTLNYTLDIFEISNEKKMLNIFHKINELIYLRGEKSVLNDGNKIHFAKYSDLIKEMEIYCEMNKKCLYLYENKEITYKLIKCFEKCFNNTFIDNSKIYPIFKLNIKDFLNLHIHKHISSQEFQFFLFLYLEKFLYSFSLFSYKYSIKNLSEGVILYNFENVNTVDLNNAFFYLLMRDINCIISIIIPIYINTILIYKSRNLKEKIYKIYNLIENKSCKTIFIEEEDDLLDVIKLENTYAHHITTKNKEKNTLCDYNNFFLLNIILDENHNDTENFVEHFDLSEMLIKAHINFMKIHKKLKRKIEIQNNYIQKKNSKLNLCKNNLETKNGKEKLDDKEKMNFLEKNVFSNIFDFKYFIDAANKYHEDALIKNETEKKIIDFITQSNLHNRKIINKKIQDVSIGDMYIYYRKNESKKEIKKEKAFIDLEKVFRKNVTTCIFRDNLN
ncbi:hypothetical protein PGAL8A_00100100 [Plasmodium gallinaceum]|uniref:Uncharacterized protein n=1 Tax=Plasmodium gallinaceum TaxID=5849 RepID=A0A1J1GPS7_PLAGA|nr:hypothetical protein PGAL8A_00100100 [Plasmodium gallinaceum]CRG93295.1 hypothetical protein PGAL8A_00100100 [Plasmodium gallinaceum]